MEVEEIQAQSHKFPRRGNGSTGRGNHDLKTLEIDDHEAALLDLKKATADGGSGNCLHGWHHSRIIRVSRASGGKDRHSKVWTSKGLRDRRVRLSVTTAIQFYDLQDRLGYDQPSKAVEWLIKAAEDAISELPSLNSSFPDTPKQLSDENRASCEHGFDSAELEMDPNYQMNLTQNQSQHLSLSKSSACSSTSETSKGSGGLSLSRSDIKVNREKARERARERAAKDREKETNTIHNGNISQNASFTELLTGGIGGGATHHNVPNNSNSPQDQGAEPILFDKAPMDYFSSGLLGLSSSTRSHRSSGFSGQIHLGMNSINPQTMSVASPFNVSGDQHHFSFDPDHLIPVSQSGNGGGGGGGSDYNLNFSISSSGGLAGFNRGTLQSNSSTPPSLVPHHLQRFSPIDGSSNVPFFFGASAAAPMENHHQQQQFPTGFDRRLQQLYSDGTRHSDHKGKAKN